ncbi:protein MIZU-KUSSEI 1-like [Phragmites australis]|uniref:protein MIZU-KUSSEI 1-like n=1 Tax=Phragmites australis TaxID=29695 RepID=UPI002D76E1ED|nr:protein MIZU-KUSSEI 1-like [Phragmites australis]
MKKKSGASNYMCIAPIFNSCVPSGKQQPSNDAGKNRRTFSFPESLTGGKDQRQQQPEEQNSESIIDPAASIITRKDGRHCTVIVGTIFGPRTGRVTFCVQRDAAVPPPFLFELSVPMQSLAAEMGSGLLRIALECHRPSSKTHDVRSGANTNATMGGSSGRNIWKASCNGRDVGYAMRRRPTDWDRHVLETMRTMTTGVGVLPSAVALEGANEGEQQDGGGGELEVMYMRATYERIIGSRDAVSYHLISPGTTGGSPPQELSVFLLRTRDRRTR